MGLSVIISPAIEPLTLDEAKEHLRVTADVDDGYIQSLIPVARLRAENATHRAIMTQTLRLTLDRFPCGGGAYGAQPIVLPRPPLQGITSISYIDVNGATQSLSSADYLVNTNEEPGSIYPVYGTYWPSSRATFNAVTITYVAGWTEENVPETVQHLCRLFLSHMYENREPAVIGTSVLAIPDTLKSLISVLRWGDEH